MNRLQRPLTVLELVQIQKMFSVNMGYKDLIRDFKHDFGLVLDKPTAKKFIQNRSWSEVLFWLTGDTIAPADSKIPVVERKKYELLERMMKCNIEDTQHIEELLNEFEADEYWFPDTLKYFNFPLYGEIITYKHKEPFLKCFLLDAANNGKITKIEDVPISNELPQLLLRIIRKINDSKILTNKTFKEQLEDSIRTPYYISSDEAESKGYKNIFESKLFKELKITYKN